MDRDLEEAYKEIEQYLLENVTWFETPAPIVKVPVTTLAQLPEFYERVTKSKYERIPGYEARSQTAGGLSIKRIELGYEGPTVRLARREPGNGYFYCLINSQEECKKLPSGMTQHSTGIYWYHYRCCQNLGCSFCDYWGVYAMPE